MDLVNQRKSSVKSILIMITPLKVCFTVPARSAHKCSFFVFRNMHQLNRIIFKFGLIIKLLISNDYEWH